MNNKYDNPILICIGSHNDFHDDGELFCGGCGYQYSPDEAEAMFKDVKIKVADTCGMEVHTKPLRCIRCCRRYETVYFSELGEVSKIVPLNLFKKRYVLEAFRKHCYIPDKNCWLTLDQIEHRRQEIVGESGRWEDNPWQIIILSLTKEQLKAIREQIANSKDFKFDVNDENAKTYISEEE